MNRAVVITGHWIDVQRIIYFGPADKGGTEIMLSSDGGPPVRLLVGGPPSELVKQLSVPISNE